MKDRDAQFGFSDLERKLNERINEIQTTIVDLNSTVDSLTNTVNQAIPTSYAEIQNLLDNSYIEWSKDAYLNLGVLPATVTDDNREAYNWYRVETSETDFIQNDANALKAAGHSTFAANEGTNLDIPRWDIVNGYAEVGGTAENWMLIYKMPNDLVMPGFTFYVQFEAMLRTTDPMPNVQAFAAFYDNTAGQKKIIEGGNFTITGEIFGDQSGTETVEYQVVAKTDSGEQAISNILSFPNAPSTFTQDTHPRINFSGAPGFITFEIYRHFQGQYVLQFIVQNSTAGSYFDVGNPPIRPVPSFPSLTATPPKAYAGTVTFQPGSLNGAGFVRHSFTIFVPTTYNYSLTSPGEQWFMFGLSGLTDVERQIVFRRIGVSLGDGNWSRSATDNAQGIHSSPSVTATSSPSGNTGTPPPPRPGTGYCVTLDTLIDVITDKGKEKITLEEVSARWRTENIYCVSGSATAGRVTHVRQSHSPRVFEIVTTSGKKVLCTPEHPFITNNLDIFGTPAKKLKKCDIICELDGDEILKTRIESITELFGDYQVGIVTLEGTSIFSANGLLTHNAKELPE